MVDADDAARGETRRQQADRVAGPEAQFEQAVGGAEPEEIQRPGIARAVRTARGHDPARQAA